MIIFPAIDLKDGVCVRLKKGVMEDATVFNTDPGAQAASFAAQGFAWLHCVDLNGAFAGHSANTDAIKSIRAAIDLPIQLGGGIRDMKAVDGWLAAGITRVILGTAALTDPQFVKDAARAYPGRIVVGADAKGGRIATQGWADVSDLTPVGLALGAGHLRAVARLAIGLRGAILALAILLLAAPASTLLLRLGQLQTRLLIAAGAAAL